MTNTSAHDNTTNAPDHAGAMILDRIEAAVRRYCVLPGNHEYAAVTLWVAHTHFIEAFDCAPRLIARSPEKRSGKTRLLEVVAELVYNPLRAINATTAALYRTLNTRIITLLLDETDALFGTALKAAQNEDLRAFVNAGFQRRNPVLRVAGHDHEPTEYNTFAPVAMAGIGRLPETIEDRAVVIRMRRKTDSEMVQPYRHTRDAAALHQLRDELHEWAKQDNPEALLLANGDTRVDLPAVDRAADVWEPLIIVAELAGGHWPALGRAACKAMTDQSAEEDTALTPGQQLLADIREIFTTEFMTSQGLCDALNALPESPWHDMGLTPTKLGQRLRQYEIKTGHTADKSARGYHRTDFLDAFTRYLPPPPRPTPSTASATGTDQHQRPDDPPGAAA
ncbi:hypothetical protein DDT46_07665 [Mycobacteroides abscessus]|uniref:DUF3631 domain-containing protein n=1 Tax=Mycobacteroides abscessus TaxID=36809 RepID=UPI000D52FBFF|nr:DUF3631 domain-containing protein [Mycobacteroides abscessus]AWG63682.1 hypothetical protein DDT46_07665 [Mycobacteroides abscessus]RIS87972.1 DUF3631 domain-containing protein [Mycobacteroides abscessus]